MIESFEQVRDEVFDYLAVPGSEILPETNSEVVWLITTGGLNREQITQLPPKLAAYQRAMQEVESALGYDSNEVVCATAILSTALGRVLRARTHYKGRIVPMEEVRTIREGEIRHIGAKSVQALQRVFGAEENIARR